MHLLLNHCINLCIEGTVSEDIASLVQQYTSGVSFKSSSDGYVDLGLGKCSLTNAQLKENMDAITKEINQFRQTPAGMLSNDTSHVCTLLR